MYDNSSWDLVDALETGKVKLDNIQEKELPEPLRKMAKDKRKDFLEKKVQERQELKKEIAKLSTERSKYVAKKKMEAGAPSVATMEQAVTKAIQKQGEAKNYKFTK